jgi:hypothetical protein
MAEGPKNRGAVQRTTIVSMKSRGVVSQPEDRHRSRTTDLPFLLDRDILKVTNVDNVSWDFKWDRRVYLIRPGETATVPFPAIVMRLGDPRSVEGEMQRYHTDDGQTGIIATRWESLCTLFSLYAIENYNVADLVEFAPKVEVRTLDTDELVTFPAQNPDMIGWPIPQAPQPGRETSDQRRITEQLRSDNASMREEIAELRQMVSERLGGAEGEPEPEDEDPLAAALTGQGATIDQGPAGTF